MRSGGKLSDIGKIEILCNKESRFPLCGFPERGVCSAAQVLLRNCVNVVAEVRQNSGQRERKILVELDPHCDEWAMSGVDDIGRSSAAEVAANAMAACTSSGLKAGKSARIASGVSTAAKLARIVRSVTRVPLKTGSPPQICGSLMIRSSYLCTI